MPRFPWSAASAKCISPRPVFGAAELTAAAQKGLIFQGLREGLLSQLAEFESPSGDLILYRHVNRNRVSDGIRVRRHQFLESRPVLVGSGQIFQTLSLDHQIPGQIDRAII